MSKVSYSAGGVNLKSAYNILKTISKSTGKSIRHFGSVVEASHLGNGAGPYRLAFSCDGVGTKIEILRRLKLHWISGWDAVAMNANDLLCVGARPLWFLDYYAQGRLQQGHFKGVLNGMQRALKEIGAELIGGETAELPGMFAEDAAYDISGFLAGVAEPTSLAVNTINPGDLLVGLPSSGPHSNGFSLIRKIIGWSDIKSQRNSLLAPTKLYHRMVYPLIAEVSSGIKSVAHITGGGFMEKLPRSLPVKYRAVLNRKSWREPAIFKWLRAKAGLSFEEAAGVWNLGIGLVMVVDPVCWPRLSGRLGAQAKVIGNVEHAQSRGPLVVFQ
ncbi:MAG: phosphoribosylformylglycinamidine cyclo-ligase [Elusimicrobia bacterium]|nr:phosphoribosylformylglycinamidine cyclo-ligase [Elusimicrobiota bacterium]